MEDLDGPSCGHPECGEIMRRLQTIREEQGFEAWEAALYTLGYCAPRHEDEADYGDMPPDAGQWIDPVTMPHTARRWQAQQRERELQAQKKEQEALDAERLQEIEIELREEHRNEEFCLALWQRLTAESTHRALSRKEQRDVHYCELYFGGRDELVAYAARAVSP